jgi:hypothetical protein
LQTLTSKPDPYQLNVSSLPDISEQFMTYPQNLYVAATLSITLIIKTLSIKGLFATLGINGTQHTDTKHNALETV